MTTNNTDAGGREARQSSTPYRYYAKGKSSSGMVAALGRHLSKVGTLLEVRGESHGAPGREWYRVVVRGSLGWIQLPACSWGYQGEGPRATYAVLMALGVHRADAAQAAFQAPNQEVGRCRGRRVFWRLWLCPGSQCLSQLPRGQFQPALPRHTYASSCLTLLPHWSAHCREVWGGMAGQFNLAELASARLAGPKRGLLVDALALASLRDPWHPADEVPNWRRLQAAAAEDWTGWRDERCVGRAASAVAAAVRRAGEGREADYAFGYETGYDYEGEAARQASLRHGWLPHELAALVESRVGRCRATLEVRAALADR